MDTRQKIEHAMKELDRLMESQRELQGKLHTAMLLESFEPRAFSHGSCKLGGVGNVRHNPKGAKIRITLGNREVLEYPLLEVPYELWPESMKLEFLDIPKAHRPKLKRATQ